jgi:hypothetical protein
MVVMVFNVFQLFFKCFKSIFKCFNCFQMYAATLIFKCFKSRSGITSLLLLPATSSTRDTNEGASYKRTRPPERNGRYCAGRRGPRTSQLREHGRVVTWACLQTQFYFNFHEGTRRVHLTWAASASRRRPTAGRPPHLSPIHVSFCSPMHCMACATSTPSRCKRLNKEILVPPSKKKATPLCISNCLLLWYLKWHPHDWYTS